MDAFPFDPDETLDTDGDGVGNNRDTDDDNDGVADADDDLPLNPNEVGDNDSDGIGDRADTDDDNDGILDDVDLDADGDGWLDQITELLNGDRTSLKLMMTRESATPDLDWYLPGQYDPVIELHADGTYEGFHGAIGEVGDWHWDPLGQAVELQAHRGRVLWLDVSQSGLVWPDNPGSTIRLRDDDQGRSMYLTEDDLTGVMDLGILEQLFAEDRMSYRSDADFRVMAFPTRTLTFKQVPMTKRGFDIEMREENHFVAMQDRRRLDDWVSDQEGNAQLGEFMRCYVTEPSLGSIPGGFDAL